MDTFSKYMVSVSIAEFCSHPVSVMRNNYIRHGKVDFIDCIKNNGISYYYKTSPIIITKQIVCMSSKLSIYNYIQKFYDKNPVYNFINSFFLIGNYIGPEKFFGYLIQNRLLFKIIFFCLQHSYLLIQQLSWPLY